VLLPTMWDVFAIPEDVRRRWDAERGGGRNHTLLTIDRIRYPSLTLDMRLSAPCAERQLSRSSTKKLSPTQPPHER
jgi:hypothetical protein